MSEIYRRVEDLLLQTIPIGKVAEILNDEGFKKEEIDKTITKFINDHAKYDGIVD